MKACMAKLQSKKGASLILAAVFFLICAFVGGTVLAAATGGTAHLVNRRSDEQSYLLQRSAARILKEELAPQSGYLQMALEKQEQGNYVLQILNPADPTTMQCLAAHGAAALFGADISEFAYTCSRSCEQNFPSEGTILLSMSESGQAADTLAVRYALDENYDFTATVADSNGEPGLLYVFMKANVTKNGDSLDITWNTPMIRKGQGTP